MGFISTELYRVFGRIGINAERWGKKRTRRRRRRKGRAKTSGVAGRPSSAFRDWIRSWSRDARQWPGRCAFRPITFPGTATSVFPPLHFEGKTQKKTCSHPFFLYQRDSSLVLSFVIPFFSIGTHSLSVLFFVRRPLLDPNFIHNASNVASAGHVFQLSAEKLAIWPIAKRLGGACGGRPISDEEGVAVGEKSAKRNQNLDPHRSQSSDRVGGASTTKNRETKHERERERGTSLQRFVSRHRSELEARDNGGERGRGRGGGEGAAWRVAFGRSANQRRPTAHRMLMSSARPQNRTRPNIKQSIGPKKITKMVILGNSSRPWIGWKKTR